MSLSEFTPNLMLNLIEQWNNTAKSNINPDDCKNLISNTEQIGVYLENLEKDQSRHEQMADLCKAVLKGLGKLEKKESIIEWFDNNSNIGGGPAGLTEACKSLHHLFSAVKANTSEEVENSNFAEGLAILKRIDSEAETHIHQVLPNEMISSVYDKMDAKDLLAMREVSKDSRDIANYIFIKRLNKGEVSFLNLKIATKKDMISFFGEDGAKTIIHLDFLKINPINHKETLNILCISQLAKAKELKLPAYYELDEDEDPQNISALKYCKQLESLNMTCNGNIDLSVIGLIPTLQKLDLTCCENLSDIKFLANCTNLITVTISQTEVSDITVLEDLLLLKTVYCSGCNIPDSSIKKLRDREINVRH